MVEVERSVRQIAEIKKGASQWWEREMGNWRGFLEWVLPGGQLGRLALHFKARAEGQNGACRFYKDERFIGELISSIRHRMDSSQTRETAHF